MSNLKMIEMLCVLVEEQAKAIRYLATELAHERNLSVAETEMVEQSRRKYSQILGTDEVPDEYET